MRRSALFLLLGAGLAYLFDPQNGKRRRHSAVDRTAGFLRRTLRRADRARRHVTADARGTVERARHLGEEKPVPNDETLKEKVESEVFRDPDLPKGRVNVNAENGVVFLRGEVDSPDLVEQLESATRKVQGVRDVENLLHTPEERGA